MYFIEKQKQKTNNMSLINTHHQFKKGEMIVNMFGWPGIVIEATRGNDPAIINCVEVFGFEHESGSMYTNEVVRRIDKIEFEKLKKETGHENESIYFKGQLIESVS